MSSLTVKTKLMFINIKMFWPTNGKNVVWKTWNGCLENKTFPLNKNWSSTKQLYNTRIKVGISRKSIYRTFSVLIFVYIELHF